jgi:hypothetical protein
MLKTLAQDDQFYPSCGKTCEGIIGKRATEPFVPSAYFKKSRDTKISFAAQVRY